MLAVYTQGPETSPNLLPRDLARPIMGLFTGCLTWLRQVVVIRRMTAKGR